MSDAQRDRVVERYYESHQQWRELGIAIAATAADQIKQRCPGCGAMEFLIACSLCTDCMKLQMAQPEPTPDHIKYAENPPI